MADLKTGNLIQAKTIASDEANAAVEAFLKGGAVRLFGFASGHTLDLATTVILMKLRRQRAELFAILADLKARASSGDARIEAINANMRRSAREGLTQIDLFIRQACRVV